MSNQPPQYPAASVALPAPRATLWSRRPRLLRNRVFGAALAACLLATLYWGLVASDRYVSEAHVIVQRTDVGGGQGKDFGSFLAVAVDGSHGDQLLLRDYLLSPDILAKLDAKLKLRTHYSDSGNDLLSRMWSRDAAKELFYRYYLSRVSIELDDYAGVLVIKAQGYDPKTAQAIAAMLVQEGEAHMNEMGRRLALEQVVFMERQAAEMGERFRQARRDVLAYQNRKGLVSPQSTAESLAGVINRLEAERSELQARRTALLGYLAPKAAGVIELNLQIDAVEQQIAEEQARLTAPAGKTLNSTVEEFQRLELSARFAEDAYKTTLVALEKGRFEAARTLKKVSVLRTPALPEYALEPQRLYNIAVFILATLILAGIVHLLATIIRDHKD
jgi:capsular polysaccharide transport system permease protein